jgi:hypothetical protein
VLNGSPGCCCCDPSPLTAGQVRQRPHGMMGMVEAMTPDPVLGRNLEETISYNTWIGGVPPQLSGRVDPAVWAAFVSDISVLQQMQKTCIQQCLSCNCSEADLKAGLIALEQNYGPKLGAVGFAKLDYRYQVWNDGQRNEDGSVIPGRWENASFDYLRVEFSPAQMSMPGQAQFMAPQGVTMNPMMLQGY